MLSPWSSHKQVPHSPTRCFIRNLGHTTLTPWPLERADAGKEPCRSGD